MKVTKQNKVTYLETCIKDLQEMAESLDDSNTLSEHDQFGLMLCATEVRSAIVMIGKTLADFTRE